MADDASSLREQPPARPRVARRIKVIEREEEGDQIPGLLGVELRPGDAELRHPRGHARGVVPQSGGEIVERPRPGDASEIRADLPADSVDRMAFDAALRAEDPRAGERILRRAEQGLGVYQGGTEHDEHDEAGEQPCENHGVVILLAGLLSWQSPRGSARSLWRRP